MRLSEALKAVAEQTDIPAPVPIANRDGDLVTQCIDRQSGRLVWEAEAPRTRNTGS